MVHAAQHRYQEDPIQLGLTWWCSEPGFNIGTGCYIKPYSVSVFQLLFNMHKKTPPLAYYFTLAILCLLYGLLLATCSAPPSPMPTNSATTSKTTPRRTPTPGQTATLPPKSTPQPALTATPLPTSLPSATSLPTTTRTIAPFLPSNLAIISPQNAPQLKRVAVLPEQSASVVAYSPDSRRVAAGFFVTNQVKNLGSRQRAGAVHPQRAYRPTHHFLPGLLSRWLEAGLRRAGMGHAERQPHPVGRRHRPRAAALQRRLGSHLTRLAPGSAHPPEQGQGVTLILSELASGKEIHTLKAPGDIYGVTFSPNGQHVAAKMYNVFQDLFSFWSVDSGQLDRTLYDWAGFSYSPDDRFIAALLETGSGVDKGELNIFAAVSFKWIKTLGKEADTLWYAYPTFSPDGQVLAASFGDHVILWDTQAWKELASLPISSPTGFAFSPDGRILTTYTLSGMVQLWGVVEEE